jgi:signal transduction histidine kinase
MERDKDDSQVARPREPGSPRVVLSQDARTPTAQTASLPMSLADELFSILSHELRAPLTTIKGSSRTLLRHGAAIDPAAARQLAARQLLEDIDQEADRLHRLVDNLLELARAGIGSSALHTEPTAVDLVIRRVVADMTPRAGSRRLRVRIPARLPQPSIDPVRVEQVIRNLVDNAVKFSPPEGIIDVSAMVQRNAVVVSVRDEGPGIAPEYQGRVFDRFFRVQRANSSVAGAGLGLAICKRFVELHGGEIELDSLPGQGATFRFTLPLGKASAVNEAGRP